MWVIRETLYRIPASLDWGVSTYLHYAVVVIEVNAPASPAFFLSGNEQEKEVAHCDTGEVTHS
jgi:hypothetical protein